MQPDAPIVTYQEALDAGWSHERMQSAGYVRNDFHKRWTQPPLTKPVFQEREWGQPTNDPEVHRNREEARKELQAQLSKLLDEVE